MTAKEIVREVKRCIEISGDSDRQHWARREEMLALIADGARIIQDRKQHTGTHLTEVIYTDESGEEIRFIHTGVHPLFPTSSTIH